MKRRKRLIRHDENDENVGMLQVFGVSSLHGVLGYGRRLGGSKLTSQDTTSAALACLLDLQ